MTEALVERLGFDRLPEHLRDKSVAGTLDLTNRIAIVTGGGGQGLGRAIVDRLASQGATVVVVDRLEQGAADTAQAVAARWGVDARAMACDVTDAAAVDDLFNRVVEIFGRVDILVNDVGGGGPRGFFAENSLEAIEAGVQLNLMSQIYCTQAAVRQMTVQGSGSIVCVSSEGGKVGMPGLVVYNACKAAILGLVRSLAFEVSKSGIRVNAVCPGIMLVPGMIDRVRDTPEGGAETLTLEYAFGRVPLGRGCLPEEVANVVAFLASDAASYVQGAAWSVGGGQEL